MITHSQGECALITGARQGIGAGLVEAHLREGAKVAIAGIRLARGKAPVVALSQPGALNLPEHGIDVKADALGGMDGAQWDRGDACFVEYESKSLGQKTHEVGEAVPYGRTGRAADLSGLADFPASEEAEYIVARTCNADGGQWMS